MRTQPWTALESWLSLTLFGAAPIVQASISQGMLVMSAEAINEAIVPWNMTLTGEGKGLLQLAFKGHEMTFQITRISWEENEESSETGK
jgi:hypothetical protein